MSLPRFTFAPPAGRRSAPIAYALMGLGVLGGCASVPDAPEPAPVVREEKQPCGPRRVIAAHLGMVYGERPAAYGIEAHGLVLEIFARPDGESWTALLSHPDGKSCLIYTGESWQALNVGRGS